MSIVGAHRWVYLFPLIAARLGAGLRRRGGDGRRGRFSIPRSRRLPGDLAAALEAAGEAWDRGEPSLAGQHLEAALRLARDRDYF